MPFRAIDHINVEAIAQFDRTMRENITVGEIPFRNATIQSL